MAETGDWSRCIIPFDEANARVHERGFSHPFVGAAIGAGQLQMHLSVIRPGEAAHPPHSHAGEEIMFLLEGQAEATIGDERHQIGPQTALFCPEHVLHGLRNCGEMPMRYLVIRTA
ncbi:MAG TPA: cupin domain-containing protein [Limnochordia bacterium]|nr:cupin domain-containing protein [Limnochordia bacterium]